MQFISPRIHGALDYSVAVVLVVVPLVLGFAESSAAAAVLSIAGGIGLFFYSLFTDYSAGLRGLIPFRLHLIFDAVAAVVLIAAPFLFGFDGIARGFYITVGAAVLVVVACTRPDEVTAAPALGTAASGAAR